MINLIQQIYMKEKFPLSNDEQMHHVNAITDPDTGKSLEYRHLIKNKATQQIWNKSYANELGRLANGVDNNRVKGTQTIEFIKRNQIP